MIIRRSLETVATSNVDDAAYLALKDVARMTEGLDDVRVSRRPHGQPALDRIPDTGSSGPSHR